jgi:hypothetical protein
MQNEVLLTFIELVFSSASFPKEKKAEINPALLIVFAPITSP